jgi:hypothetical protein
MNAFDGEAKLLRERNPKTFKIAEKYTYEELASALYAKGLADGYGNVTTHSKWRELIMAELLGHKANSMLFGGDHEKSDAYDEENGAYAEYKSQTIKSGAVRNLIKEEKHYKNGNTKVYSALKVCGIYNGAYKQSAIDKCKDVDHYFGVFYNEECVLLIKPKTEEVIRQLEANLKERNKKKHRGPTTLSQVHIDLDDTHLYEIYIDKREGLQS